MLENKKILVTGATGQVARPIAEDLVRTNEVWCAARFTQPALRREIEDAGIRSHAWTLGSSDLGGLPDDFDCVIHAACSIYDVGHDDDASIATNAEGTGILMSHCRRAEAFLYVSSLAAYKPPETPGQLWRERSAALGGSPIYAPSYGIGKVATEAVVRTLSRTLGLPATIARLGSAYGRCGHGGVPSIAFRRLLAGEALTTSKGSYHTLISERDIVADVEPLLAAAAVPATVVNWCSDETVEERELYEFVARVAGLELRLEETESGWYGYAGGGDPGLRNEIAGPARVPWKRGVLASLRANFPDHVFAEPE